MSGNNKIKNLFGKVHWSVWLALIIVFALCRLIFLFSLRDGHHVDETWSYGYANSYYFPYVFGGYSDETEANIGEWISGDVFKDYITVDEDQRFSFDSVIFNKKDDLSPVLYAFILHFICSFFPGQFSWWFAFIVSLLFFVPSLILMFILSKEITDSKLCGFLTVIYYIFSGCGSANFLYLRVYHIFTFLTLLLFFFIHRILKNDGKGKWIYYCLLPVVTLLGCLTHYYFLVMAFGLTLFGAIIIIFGKRLRDAFRLCYIMLLSVIVFFLIYSPALNKLLPYATEGASSGTTGYYSYPYYFDLAIANVHFFQGTIGWFIQFDIISLMYFLGIVVFVAIIVALIIFVFRNELWMKKFVEKSKGLITTSFKCSAGFFKTFNPSIFIALFASIFYMLVIPYSATLVNMGFTERYFFPAMSLFIVVYMSFMSKLIIKIFSVKRNRKIAVCSTVIVCALLVFFDYRSNYFTELYRFKNWSENELLSELSNKNVYFIINADRDMVCFSSLLYKSNNIYVDYQSSFDEEDFTVPELGSDCILLIINEGLLSEEQKSELLSDNALPIYGLMKPDVLKTEDDIIDVIEESTGFEYEQVGKYLNFLGYVSIYRNSESTAK